MKKITLFLACLALLATACSKMESNEKKYTDGMMDEDFEVSNRAFDEFCKWLETDEETMTHDFMLMREKLGMKVKTSADGKLRTYSWQTAGSDTDAVYANVLQWKAGENFVAFRGPLDKLLAGRKANIKQHATLAHSIDTIFQIASGETPLYIIAQSYVGASGMRRAYVSAATITGVKLTLLPFMFSGVEIAGNNLFVDTGNISIGDLFKWDEKAHRFYAYQVDDNNHVIPGKYTIYELGEHQFNRLPDAPAADEQQPNN